MNQQDVLLTLLHSGVAQCQVVLDGQGSLLVSLFLLGLVGGVTHCAGMCGPFVLSQVAARLEGTSAARMNEWSRLQGALVLPYHLGRATSYGLLGGAGALLAGTLEQEGGLHWLSAGLLLLAALFMLAMAIPALKRLLGSPGGTGETWWSRRVGTLARPLFEAPTGWRGYLLGVMLGFIPCGLLYGALAAASATGGLVNGVFGMLAFAAGTVPTLVAVGLVGHMAGQRWRATLLRWAPLLLILNAGVLTLLAWRHVA